MQAVADQLDLDVLNPAFEKQSAQQIIDWSNRQFGDELVMTSSFGDQAVVLIHLATQIKPDIKIIFVDTGYLFPETHLFMEQVRQRFNLNVWTYRSKNDPIQYLKDIGETDPMQRKDKETRDACCAANKYEPTERAFKTIGAKAYLRGIRRQQNKDRKNAPFILWDPRYGCYAISPMLNWTSKDVGVYMKQHDLPYHPLIEKGYLSIGCNPLACTRPVQIGEDPRAGRWAGSGKTECGINSLDSANL
jgi:phosphoadenosine phosphosulfate reductase